MPPCTFGCRVLTRPSIISGNPVTSEMPMTAKARRRPAPCAVPPVETSSHPRPPRPRANGTRPVLSDTLSNARMRRGSILFYSSWGPTPTRAAAAPLLVVAGFAEPRGASASPPSASAQASHEASSGAKAAHPHSRRSAPLLVVAGFAFIVDESSPWDRFGGYWVPVDNPLLTY